MPWGDGTGPLGLGPMTGRAAGFCAGYPVPGFMNPIPGRGWWRFRFFGFPLAEDGGDLEHFGGDLGLGGGNIALVVGQGKRMEMDVLAHWITRVG